jgi:hypothetical protein
MLLCLIIAACNVFDDFINSIIIRYDVSIAQKEPQLQLELKPQPHLQPPQPQPQSQPQLQPQPQPQSQPQLQPQPQLQSEPQKESSRLEIYSTRVHNDDRRAIWRYTVSLVNPRNEVMTILTSINHWERFSWSTSNICLLTLFRTQHSNCHFFVDQTPEIHAQDQHYSPWSYLS